MARCAPAYSGSFSSAAEHVYHAWDKVLSRNDAAAGFVLKSPWNQFFILGAGGSFRFRRGSRPVGGVPGSAAW